MDGYITKPIDTLRLLETIETLLSAAPRATANGLKENGASSMPADTAWATAGNASSDRRTGRGANAESPFHVESLLGRCMGDVALCRKILRSLSDRGPQQRVAVEQSMAAGDLTALAEAAHSLKGTAANFSAERLREAAGQVERLAKAGAWQSVRGAGEELLREFQRALDAIPATIERLAETAVR
jgi:HPt (histidine-containing phosphotransfer) domain-containing protein